MTGATCGQELLTLSGKPDFTPFGEFMILLIRYTYTFSLVGRLGYPAPPGNINLIDVSRLEKMRRKRLAMLTSRQNVPRALFMQISAAITEN